MEWAESVVKRVEAELDRMAARKCFWNGFELGLFGTVMPTENSCSFCWSGFSYGMREANVLWAQLNLGVVQQDWQYCGTVDGVRRWQHTATHIRILELPGDSDVN